MDSLDVDRVRCPRGIPVATAPSVGARAKRGTFLGGPHYFAAGRQMNWRTQMIRVPQGARPFTGMGKAKGRRHPEGRKKKLCISRGRPGRNLPRPFCLKKKTW